MKRVAAVMKSCGDGAVYSEMHQMISSIYAELHFMFKQDYKYDQFLGPEGNVDVELINKSANKYSLRFPTAGWYLWSATGLGFVVRDAVTVTIAFGSWSQHLALDLQHHEQWLAAGPLFAFTAEPEEAVAKIHLPHFISLQGEVDVSWFLVAHFKDEGMVLQRPSRVEPFYAVLDNPSFSLMGILLRIARGTRLSIPITSNTLLYFHPHPEDIKFHLYLVPSDALLTKMIDDEEERFCGVRLQTSPSMQPLTFGAHYIVSNSAHLEIIPTELKLSYRSPGEIQPFSKFNAGQMKEPIQLEITDKRHGTLVWKTVVKPVDIQLGAASAPRTFSGSRWLAGHSPEAPLPPRETKILGKPADLEQIFGEKTPRADTKAMQMPGLKNEEPGNVVWGSGTLGPVPSTERLLGEG
uniref:caspase recruitment domain-containing protein 8 isoform X3 n=1 Tax=Macaca mulatta TaxID=9544 RepID=UPI0010A20994|nr:caspase recruitment domain-containing protein 8 isoform X3 [Macaca mulatta]XP_028694420.1 caspase recruitment domain-containing protein 8 isoform X3 [Macaca mulatta]XP_028694421.1 caspase recruitment domain-containing protein 8 isoform X3 [Macaca mulatta]XP_028694422.1 caspase recruitment domain-containing protein 8 isoform X3 [Macaca mulatta]